MPYNQASDILPERNGDGVECSDGEGEGIVIGGGDESWNPQFQFLDSFRHAKSEPYCILESSSANKSCTTMYYSPSTLLHPRMILRMLRQLETVMLGDSDFDDEVGNGKSFAGSVVDLPDIEFWKKMIMGLPTDGVGYRRTDSASMGVHVGRKKLMRQGWYLGSIK
ncbi:hypothetical protein L1987_22711 [Smallanthus sonchifolius]|uniref:Uncharacterized protein n=1 Tax=Smallanthus sonchifolius TaxID=185202 RepID=A0ACB9IG80_9ASTR|nr:hypothetical protein L1987_22711 [Smallanthus sonchifolius]